MIPITLSSDLDQLRENWVTNPMDYLSGAHISPDGDRVALTSRGRRVRRAGEDRPFRARVAQGQRALQRRGLHARRQVAPRAH